MIDSTFGVNIAPATPWIKRATTSCKGVAAAPHAREATVNSASPAENRRRRPKRSPSRPAVITKTAEVSA